MIVKGIERGKYIEEFKTIEELLDFVSREKPYGHKVEIQEGKWQYENEEGRWTIKIYK
jgi:hypothetical protein